MKVQYILPLVGFLTSIQANEALDILEGKKDAAAGTTATLPADDAALITGATTPAVDGKVVKPYVPMVPSAFSQQSKQFFDPIWSKSSLILDEKNSVVQELSIIGLFEAGAAWGDIETTSSTGTATTKTISDVELRRAQIGARMRAFYRTEVTGIVEGAGPSQMNGIQTLKARTGFNDNTGVTIGKFRPLSTLENNIPDGQLLTTERAMLSNMLSPADSLGVMFDAKSGNWQYNLGWFSGDYSDMIPGIKNDGFINAGLAYETTTKTESGAPLRSRWYINLINNLDRETSEVIPRNNRVDRPTYNQIVSTGISIQQDRFSFQGDFTMAHGDKSVWGMTLTPSYWIMPGTIQLVGRYHYADSDTEDALYSGYGPGADPWLDSDSVISGDEFHSFYIGANVHLYENRMIIFNGLEYTLFKDDLDSASETKSLLWQSGARLSF